MHRLFFLLLLLIAVGWPGPVAAQAGAADGLPPRPTPFRFVNDQAQLLAPADAKKLESGLRRYADNTGTQVVVVTVPSLGGREVADYGRALGTAWGVGQLNKNNGLVVLLSAQEHQVTIQPGSGLASTITPAVTSRVIGEMTPKFKQGNYFAGLRAGLNTLMATANPGSAPKNNQSGAATSSSPTSVGTASGAAATGAAETSLTQNEPARVPSTDPLLASPPTEPVSSGPGMGTVLIGALLVGGLLWFLVRMFRRRSTPNNASYPGAPSPTGPPNFLPNRPNGPGGGYGSGGGYGPGQGPGNYGGSPNSGGMGMGGILATGAAAAAGAYLGNRLASGHETSGNSFAGDGTASSPVDPHTTAGAAGAAGAGALGTGAADDYFASRNGADNTAPDYFSGNDSADNSSADYFSSADNSSYDDLSADDTGGGGFDSNDDNSGSW